MMEPLQGMYPEVFLLVLSVAVQVDVSVQSAPFVALLLAVRTIVLGAKEEWKVRAASVIAAVQSVALLVVIRGVSWMNAKT